MAISFKSKITKRGNIHVDKEVLELIGADVGDSVIAAVQLIGEKNQCCGECGKCLSVPTELMVMAGISPDAKLEVYAEDGRIIIQEADEDDE